MRQVERLASVLGCYTKSFALPLRTRQTAQVNQRQLDVKRRLDPLHRFTIRHMECGSPGLVTSDDFGEAALECGNIQRPIAAHRERLPIKASVRSKVGTQPKLLRQRKGKRGVPPGGRGGWGRKTLRPHLQIRFRQLLPLRSIPSRSRCAAM